MGERYIVREHLIIKNTADLRDTTKIAYEQLLHLGELIFQKRAVIFNMTLIVDGKKYAFGAHSLSGEYGGILEAFENAVALELTMDYFYIHKDSGDMARLPFVLLTHVELLLKTDIRFSDRIFYSCSSRTGSLAEMALAYGKKDGRMYFGITDTII